MAGPLRQVFDTLKAQLAAEAWFAADGKRPMPAHPKRIA